ncbi:MAG: AAA family ATPase [Candidatus Eremiobacteraeota bacterium]|nr:AAA family ATPase [Candidatus Eremiobacteraeota bacterium]
MQVEDRVIDFKKKIDLISVEIGKVIVGQKEVVRDTLVALVAGGHILLEGVPGLGKTLLIRTLGEVLNLSFSRIQFTPDLMPADITGTNLVIEREPGRRVFEFQKGPVFANLVLADEINRATPKTQSALLEAMQEHTVTAAGTRYKLPQPFMVLATQNPIEMEGTYPLPEAQVDRFFFKTTVEFPKMEELNLILDRTTGIELPPVEIVIDGNDILELRKLAREVLVATPVRDYVSRIVISTHPDSENAIESTRKYIRYGSSPRGAQALVIAAKVNAIMDGRFNVGFDDVVKSLKSALRHRLILNFEAQAEGIPVENILDDLIKEVPHESEKNS